MCCSERPSEGALCQPLHILITSQFVKITLGLAIVGRPVNCLRDNVFTAHWTSITRLIDPAVKTNRVEDVLRVAFESCDLIQLVEVVKADGACLLVLVHEGVEVFACKCLRDLLE